jgi:hypothetical protein
MPSDRGKTSVSGILDELELTRRRLDQASPWSGEGKTTITIVSLAQEVEMLCQQASGPGNLSEIKELLNDARQKLDQIQILLGTN